MVKIAPSLLAADFLNLKKELEKITAAGADLLHLDIMDGHFVPNLSFGPPLVKIIKSTVDLPLDAHLMVSNPLAYIELLDQIGVDYFSFHPELVHHLHRAVHQVKETGMKAGLALNPGTSIEAALPVLPDLDFVLIMSVNPGFGGQKFLPLVYDKIAALNRIRSERELKFEIEVDGGVNNGNAAQLIKSGTDILVAGTYIFSSEDYRQRIESLKIKI